METKICSKCKIEKPISEFYVRHYPSGKVGVYSNCKECKRLWHRGWNKKRYEEDKKEHFARVARIKANKNYIKIHAKTAYEIKKRGLRPKVCPICGAEGKIISHHIDYSKRNEIIFCCQQCHMAIHRGEIKNFDVVNISS